MASGSPREGEEDIACAEWIAALLQGVHHSTDAVVAAIGGPARSREARFELDPGVHLGDQPLQVASVEGVVEALQRSAALLCAGLRLLGRRQRERAGGVAG